jgi:hypothetical protein
MRAFALILALASLCFPAQKKGKSPRPAEVEVLAAAAYRSEGVVQLDGRIRNAGERPMTKLNLFFDFFGTSNEPITTKRTEVDPEEIAPGDEAEFRVEVGDPVRAVRFQIRAEEGEGRDLKVIKPGPYVIE